MNPVIFSVGNFEVRWYSVLILCGILIAFFLAQKEAKKRGISKDFILDLGFWVVLFGLIGARIYYVIFNWDLYKGDLMEVFRVWNGGLAIHGGLIAGFITLVIYCRYKKENVLEITDIIIPSVIIAQAIGRWGNFFNSEAHGPVTSLKNLINLKIIPSFVIDGMKINGVYYHPTFYYEFLWCLLGFIILLIIRKLCNLRNGQLTCIYLMWYSVGRFFIESLRTDSLMIGTFKVAQLISVVLFGIGFFGFGLLFLKKRRKNCDI